MAKNKIIDFFKKNWLGGLIGVVAVPTILSFFVQGIGAFKLQYITDFFTDWPSPNGFGILAYIGKAVCVGGFIIGAWVQSMSRK